MFHKKNAANSHLGANKWQYAGVKFDPREGGPKGEDDEGSVIGWNIEGCLGGPICPHISGACAVGTFLRKMLGEDLPPGPKPYFLC